MYTKWPVHYFIYFYHVVSLWNLNTMIQNKTLLLLKNSNLYVHNIKPVVFNVALH